jgi:cytochrome c oxidase cbb3-type subunit 1
VAGAGLGFLGLLKFHAPNLLAGSAWLTYGRLASAQLTALVYGFGLPAGLAVALWLIARLGRTRLRLAWVAVLGAVLWNFGVTIGCLGILLGDGTGFEWLELPRYALPILGVGYALIGVSALLTFAQRQEPRLYPSQWFLLAGLFWFPWVFSTASLLLVFVPVRGVMQAVVQGWYAANLSTGWFGFIGLAVLFYLVPKLAARPLHSQPQALLAFWLLVLLGGWGGMPASAPLPAWMSSVCRVATWLLLVPVLAIAINLGRTIRGQAAPPRDRWSWVLSVCGGAAYLLAAGLTILGAWPQVDAVTQFTFYLTGRTGLFLYGFYAVTLFAAFYHLVPRLWPAGLPSGRLVTLHAGCVLAGVVLFAGPLLVGGALQGAALNRADVAFLDALKPGLMALRVATMGGLLLLIASLALATNVFWALARAGRAVCLPALAAATRTVEPEAAR